MKERIITVYNCGYCNKLYQVKNACIKHEFTCSKNPAILRPCHDCAHLTKRMCTVYYDTPYGEDHRAVSLLYCTKKDIHLITPKVQAKGEWFETDPENVFMPTECSDQKKVNFLCGE